MSLAGYLRTIRKNWWLLLIAVVLGAVGGLLMTARATAMYQSSVTFYVSTPSDAAGGNAYQANQYAVAKIQSYTKLLNSDALASRIIAVTDVDLTPGEVSSRISSSSGLNTVLLTATVTDSSVERALNIAGAIGSEFGTLVDGLDNRTDEDGRVGSTVELNVISGPTVNPDPVSPNSAVNLALGVLAGLLLGVGLASLRGLLDTTIRSADALEEFTGLPSLGRIPLESSRRKSPILIGDQLRSVRAEAYRQIRTNLQFMDLDDPIQVLLVASSVPGEGKSTTAANLAIVTAETGRRVLLVEADMRRPRVADYLGLERAVGLSNVLVGQLPTTDALQPWGTDGLMVLPSGSIPPNPSELLGSHQMVELVEQLRGMFEIIIIDTPPLLPVTDAAVAATRADGVVLVVRYGRTSHHQLSTSLASLAAVDARILGSVLSMVPKKGADSGYSTYYEDDRPISRAIPEMLRSVAPPRNQPVTAPTACDEIPAKIGPSQWAPPATPASSPHPDSAGAVLEAVGGHGP